MNLFNLKNSTQEDLIYAAVFGLVVGTVANLLVYLVFSINISTAGLVAATGLFTLLSRPNIKEKGMTSRLLQLGLSLATYVVVVLFF